MKRVLDILVSLIGLFVLGMPMLMMAALVKMTSKGPAIYWSDRVGRNNSNFLMPKFRTMCVDTPTLATHLLVDPEKFITPLGRFLRKTSLDELPQLFSVLTGEMSIVGPRPALFNQYDLIALRTERGVHVMKPGMTGWAQINGRDDLPISEKVEFDQYYLNNMTFILDLKIIIQTFIKVASSDGISH